MQPFVECRQVIDLTNDSDSDDDDTVIYPKAELHAFAERYHVLDEEYDDGKGNLYLLDRSTVQYFDHVGSMGTYRLCIDLTEEPEEEPVPNQDLAFLDAFMAIGTPEAASPAVETPNQVMMNEEIVTGAENSPFVFRPVFHFPYGTNLIHELNMQ